MTSGDTQALIDEAVKGLEAEVPALAKLTLVARLELRAHGGDAPIWRVEVPGPKVSKDPAGDARIDVSIGRPEFNRLARDGRLQDWVEAYEHGHVRVTGENAVVTLLGNVIQRQLARGGPS